MDAESFERDLEIAEFALGLARKIYNRTFDVAQSRIWTDSEESVIVPYGYDDEADPEGLLSDMPDRWHPDGGFHDDGKSSELARRALAETNLLEKRESMNGRDIAKAVNGLVLGVLNVKNPDFSEADRDMYDFARRETEKSDIYHDPESGEWGVWYALREDEKPRARPKA